MIVCAAGTWVRGPDFQVWTFINRNYIQLLTCNIIISYALATFVYAKSFQVKAGNQDKRELAAGGHSGNLIYDWYIGRELNPRVELPFFGEIDVKSFMELRPGMLGWIMLNLAFMAKQYKTYGYVTDSMRKFQNLGRTLNANAQQWSSTSRKLSTSLTHFIWSQPFSLPLT